MSGREGDEKVECLQTLTSHCFGCTNQILFSYFVLEQVIPIKLIYLHPKEKRGTAIVYEDLKNL